MASVLKALSLGKITEQRLIASLTSIPPPTIVWKHTGNTVFVGVQVTITDVQQK